MANPTEETTQATLATTTELREPIVVASSSADARSGACPFCLRKHLLKARGYARELAEDATREWEMEKLLENLLLAEDHAEALGDEETRGSIRLLRLEVENGAHGVADPAASLYDRFKKKYEEQLKQ